MDFLKYVLSNDVLLTSFGIMWDVLVTFKGGIKKTNYFYPYFVDNGGEVNRCGQTRGGYIFMQCFFYYYWGCLVRCETNFGANVDQNNVTC